jgi:transposase
MDVRRRVLEAIDQGLSRRQAAERFGVNPSSAIRWQAQRQTSGDIAPKQMGGDRRSARIEAEADFILGEIEKAPDITLAELKAKMRERAVDVSVGALWRFLDRRSVTFKKKQRTPPSSSGTT